MKKLFPWLFAFFLIILYFSLQINTTTNIEKNEIEETLNSMTLEEKIGQMIIIYETHNTVNEEVTALFNHLKPGGIILNKENITTFEQTKKYIEDIKNLSNIPLIISVDQEGGSVQRLQLLKDIVPTYIPSMQKIGTQKDPALAYEIGKILGQQAKTLGINVLYAPVCDIATSNSSMTDRSFGSDPEIVGNLCTNIGKGIEETGLIATYKHFPGHGDTYVDSHYSLPVLDKTYEELENFEFSPFKEAIANDARMIMIGHLADPKITNDTTPASLSKVFITDILKDKLNYKGLIITDALNMRALTDNYTNEEIISLAINAGVDLLLMPNHPQEAITYIKENIPVERIDESVRKILEFKKKYLKNEETLDVSYLNLPAYQEILNKIN